MGSPSSTSLAPPGAPWRWVAESSTTWVSPDQDSVARLEPLPSGSPVAVCASGPGNRARLLRAGGQGDVCFDRVYLAVPTLRSPIVLVEDSPAAVRFFLTRVLTVPPSRFPTLAWAAVSAARIVPASWLRRLAWSRVGVGWRT